MVVQRGTDVIEKTDGREIQEILAVRIVRSHTQMNQFIAYMNMNLNMLSVPENGHHLCQSLYLFNLL